MTIYETVPVEHIESHLDQDRQNIMSLLKQNKGKPYTARKIAELCGYSIKGTQVEVRKAITELIEIDHRPIVSMAKGFMWIVHINQISTYIDSLSCRQFGIERRINALKKIKDEIMEEEQQVLFS